MSKFLPSPASNFRQFFARFIRTSRPCICITYVSLRISFCAGIESWGPAEYHYGVTAKAVMGRVQAATCSCRLMTSALFDHVYGGTRYMNVFGPLSRCLHSTISGRSCRMRLDMRHNRTGSAEEKVPTTAMVRLPLQMKKFILAYLDES